MERNNKTVVGSSSPTPVFSPNLWAFHYYIPATCAPHFSATFPHVPTVLVAVTVMVATATKTVAAVTTVLDSPQNRQKTKTQFLKCHNIRSLVNSN